MQRAKRVLDHEMCLLSRNIKCLYVMSRQPYWCPETMKWRPYWCPKRILWDFSSVLIHIFPIVLELQYVWLPVAWVKTLHTMRCCTEYPFPSPVALLFRTCKLCSTFQCSSQMARVSSINQTKKKLKTLLAKYRRKTAPQESTAKNPSFEWQRVFLWFTQINFKYLMPEYHLHLGNLTNCPARTTSRHKSWVLIS